MYRIRATLTLKKSVIEEMNGIPELTEAVASSDPSTFTVGGYIEFSYSDPADEAKATEFMEGWKSIEDPRDEADLVIDIIEDDVDYPEL